MVEGYGVQIHAYVLMDNHFHCCSNAGSQPQSRAAGKAEGSEQLIFTEKR
jgi:hypothetical protein